MWFLGLLPYFLHYLLGVIFKASAQNPWFSQLKNTAFSPRSFLLPPDSLMNLDRRSVACCTHGTGFEVPQFFDIWQHLYACVRYTFSLSHNIHKISCGLCFCASDPLIVNFWKIFPLKVMKPKNKGHTNFYECFDLTKKVYLIYVYLLFIGVHRYLIRLLWC